MGSRRTIELCFICILLVQGRNRFGQDGQLVCAGKDPHGTACRNKLLCLPHPYGCSCAAGYNGIDCTEGTVRSCKMSGWGAQR